MYRSFVVAANWKMHKSPRESGEFFKNFLAQIGDSIPPGREIVFFVPAVDAMVAQESLRLTPIKWGSQNTHFEMKGAFTGENSPVVFAEIGAQFGLVGHSERRALFHETDTESGRKLKALHQVGLTPMLCVGETWPERESGRTSEVIVRQLRAGLNERDLTKKVIVAYEPVWAIGTGKVATPEQANEAHATLRAALSDIGGPTFAQNTPILYGGSVKPENAEEIARQSEVDGFLVGGASLEVGSFLALCQVRKS